MNVKPLLLLYKKPFVSNKKLIGRTDRQNRTNPLSKKIHRRQAPVQKLIYLLKGGQLVIYIVPQKCFERVTTALKCNYFQYFFKTVLFLVLPANFQYNPVQIVRRYCHHRLLLQFVEVLFHEYLQQQKCLVHSFPCFH